MKVWNAIWKTILTLATIAGIVYVLAKYGDKIVEWCKKLMGICKGCCEGDVIIEEAYYEGLIKLYAFTALGGVGTIIDKFKKKK